MRFLSCETVRDDLPAMLGGQLGPMEGRAIAAHLEACAECRAEADLLAMLRRHPVVVPPRLEARVTEAVLRRAAEPRRARWRPLAVAAATAATLLGGTLLVRHTGIAPLGDAAADDVEAAAIDESLLPPFSGSPAPGGLLAGGVRLDELSTEELELLLTELD